MTPRTQTSPRPRRSAWLLALFLLFVPALCLAGDAAAFDWKRVEIRVHHGQDLPWNKPGFRIDIAKWRPHADVSIVAVSPQGERIDLTPEPLVADDDGAMSLDVDYERTGLKPGRWTFLVGGAVGEHLVPVDLPVIEQPVGIGARPRFRLTYGTPAARAE